MGRILRMLGLVLVAAWALSLLAGEVFGWEDSRRGFPLLLLGLALMIGGGILAVATRASRMVRRPRCARCARPVQKGETYCPEHFRDAVNRIRDKTGTY